MTRADLETLQEALDLLKDYVLEDIGHSAAGSGQSMEITENARDALDRIRAEPRIWR